MLLYSLASYIEQ